MDQVGVKGAKHEEKWGPESVLKHETSSVNGDDITGAVTDCLPTTFGIDGTEAHAYMYSSLNKRKRDRMSAS